MVIILDKPFTVGDLAPDASFPHCYVTRFSSVGTSATLSVTYEFGEMQRLDSFPYQQWVSCPFPTAQRLVFQGERLLPFYTAPAPDGVGLWSAVSHLVLEHIQQNDPRCAGTISILEPTVIPAEQQP